VTVGIARAKLAADRARAAAAAAALATAAPSPSDQVGAEYTSQHRGDGSIPTSPIRSAEGALSPTRLTEAALRRHISDSPRSAAAGGSGSFAGPRSPVDGSGRPRPAGGQRDGFDPAALPFHCAADYFYSAGGGGGGGGGHGEAVVQRI
jgi:hypothetical protein